MPREFQEGTSWRTSWLLLGAHQEVTSKKPAQRGASAVRASKGEVVKKFNSPKNSKIFSA
jgi:hypothetical protein